MAGEHNELENLSKPKRGSLSIVRENRVRPDSNRSTRQIVQCAACSKLTECEDGHEFCASCGARLTLSSSAYSGQAPDIVTGHEHFHLQPPVRTVDGRRHPRIPCKKSKACIRTEEAASVIVDLVNISRGGLCFVSFEHFRPGTAISIAAHYIEGGQNIFQNCRIVRARQRPSGMLPTEYAVEFA